MGTETEQIEARPFHETIVDSILVASSAEMSCLATLIKVTKIPKGHDKIIEAWNKRRKAMCLHEDFGVPAHLLAQKEAAEEKSKAAEEKKSVNLDDLQQEVEKLLALLNDRQPGLMTWNEFMQERLQALHKLTSAVVGK